MEVEASLAYFRCSIICLWESSKYSGLLFWSHANTRVLYGQFEETTLYRGAIHVMDIDHFRFSLLLLLLMFGRHPITKHISENVHTRKEYPQRGIPNIFVVLIVQRHLFQFMLHVLFYAQNDLDKPYNTLATGAKMNRLTVVSELDSVGDDVSNNLRDAHSVRPHLHSLILFI